MRLGLFRVEEGVVPMLAREPWKATSPCPETLPIRHVLANGVSLFLGQHATNNGLIEHLLKGDPHAVSHIGQIHALLLGDLPQCLAFSVGGVQLLDGHPQGLSHGLLYLLVMRLGLFRTEQWEAPVPTAKAADARASERSLGEGYRAYRHHSHHSQRCHQRGDTCNLQELVHLTHLLSFHRACARFLDLSPV